MRRAGRPARANQRKSPLVNKYTIRGYRVNVIWATITLLAWKAVSFRSVRGARSRAPSSRSRERIRLGELGEGDRLPSERELAAAMQISRPTVREAVRVLADAGVLSVRPGPAAAPPSRPATFRWSSYARSRSFASARSPACSRRAG